MEITKEEFNSWRDNKVTKAILESIREMQNADKEYLAQGGTIAETSDFTTDYVVGRIQGMNAVLLVEYEEPEQAIEYEH